MSEMKKSEDFVEFEVIRKAPANQGSINETSFPEENECDTEQNNTTQSETSVVQQHQRPKAKASYKIEAIHNIRETEWKNEKETLLTQIQSLQSDLKQKDEALSAAQLALNKDLQTENVRRIEDEKSLLQNKNEELQSLVDEERTEKEKSFSELQEKSNKTAAEHQKRIQELEDENEGLEKNLNEQTESFNETLEKIKILETERINNEETIGHLKREVGNMKEQNDAEQQIIHELKDINMQIQSDRLDDLKQKDEAFLRLSKENEKKIRRIEDEKNLLQNKFEELQSLVDEERAEKEKSFRNLQEKSNETATEHQKCIQELEDGNEDLQKCLNEKTKSLNAALEKLKVFKTKETQMAEKLQTSCEDYQKNMNQVQTKADKLESELIAMKRERERLTLENTNQASEMQKVKNEVTSLSEERDLYEKKCKELEERHLKKVEEKEEKRKARKKMEDKRDDTRWTSNVLYQRSHPTSEGRLHFGLADAKSRIQTSSPDVQAMADLPISKQWYKTDEGCQLLKHISEKLKTTFNPDEVEYFRQTNSDTIFLTLTTKQFQKIEVYFPESFPDGPLTVSYNIARELKVPQLRGNACEEFSTEVAKALCELVFSQ